MKKRKLIIDCDPGVDDALALAYAAAHKEEFEILAVTTVSGNLCIETVTQNALDLTAFYGMEVPVARGAAAPLMGHPCYAPEFHGESGLGYCQLPKSGRQAMENAAVCVRDILCGLPEGEKATIVATAPMTNLALLFGTFPDTKERVEEIVFMGGAACGGNVTPCAEFNIYVDPEAAKMVFQSGIPLVMCGLDATMKAFLTGNQIRKLCQSDYKIAKACGDMLGFSLDHASKYRGVVSVHDVVPLMYLLHPEVFRLEKTALDVECGTGKSRGQTICDFRWWRTEPVEMKDLILMDTETEKFQEELITAIYELGGK